MNNSKNGEKKKYKLLADYSEKMLYDFIESAIDAFVLFDSKLNLIDINNVGLKIIGQKKKDVVGKNISKLILDGGELGKYKAVLRTGKSIVFEEVIPSLKNGDKNISIKAFKVGDGLGLIVSDITQERKSEEALKREKEFVDNVINAQTDTFFVFDPKTGKALRWNENFEKVCGYSHKEIKNNKAPDVYYNKVDLKKSKDGIKQLFKTGEATVEVFLITKQKKKIPFEYKISLLEVEEGAPVIVSIGRDLTDRNIIKESLKKSEEKYSSLFKNMLNGFAYHKIITNKNGKPVDYEYLEVNDSFMSLTGIRDHGHLPGKKVTEVIPGIEKDPGDWIGKYGKVALTGKDARFESYSKELDKWSSVYAFSPKKGYFATIFEDITKRKKSEELLSIKNFIFEHSYAANSISNTKGIITDVNQNFLDSWGFKNKEEVIGKSIALFFNDQKEAMSVLKVLNKTYKWKGDFVARKKDGSTFIAYGPATTLEDNKGQVIGYQSSVFDVTEQRNAEQIILHEKEKAEKYLKLAGSIIISLDKDGKVVLINKKGNEVLGYKNGDLVGKNWFECCLPKQNIRSVKKVFSSLMSGKVKLVKHYENPVRTKKGKERIVSWYNSFIKNDQGEVIGILSSGEDITEKKKVEEELEKYRFLADQATQEIAIADLQGNLLYVNNSWLKDHGYKKQELVGKNLKFSHPKKEILKIEKFNKILFKKGKNSGEVMHERKDGTTYLTQMSSFVLKINKKPVFLVATAMDITAKKKVEEELNLIINTSPIGICTVDKLGNFVMTNLAYERMLGYTKKEFVGLSFFDITHPTDRPKNKNLFQKMFSLETKSFSMEKRYVCKDGKEISVSVNAVGVKDKEGGISFGTAFVEDITERKKNEEALKKDEEKFRNIFDNSNDAIFIHAMNGKILEVNNVACKLLKYSKKKLLKLPVGKVDSVEQAKLLPKRIKKVLEKGQHLFESVHVTSDGNNIPVEVKAKVIDFDGQKAIMSVVRDITQKKKSELALMESEERFRLLYETSSDAIMILEPPTWSFTSGNTSIIKMFGVKSEKEFISLKPWQVSPEYQPDGQLSGAKAKKMIQKAMKDGSNYFEWTHKKLHGDDFFATVLLNKVKVNGTEFLQARVSDITARKNAENALAESEENYRSTIGSLAAGLVVHAADTSILFSNSEAHKILGLNEKQMIGKMAVDPSWTFVDENEVKLPLKKYPVKLVVSTKKPLHDYVLGVRRPDREYITWVVVNALPVLKQGELEKVLINFIDITEKKTAENALVQSENRYRALFEGTHDMIQSVSPDGKFDYVNKAWSRKLGYSQKDMVKMIVWDVIAPDCKKHCQMIFGQIMKGEGVNNIETSFVSKKGKVIDVEGNISLRKIDNKVVATNGFFRDVTQRNKDEQKLQDNMLEIRLQKEMLRIIVQGIGDGVIVVDNDFRIIEFNPMASKISGFSPKQVIGKKYSDVLKFVYENNRNKVNDKFIKDAIKTGKIQTMTNHTLLLTKNDTEVSVSDSAAPLRDKDGKIIGCVVVFRDATKEREIERVKSDFVSIASHQLRTPLTGTKWFAELLLREKAGELNDKQRSYVNKILISNKNLIRLVSDLLDVSHIETGRKFDIVKEKTEMCELINKTIDDNKELIMDKKIKVTHKECLCSPIKVDKNKILQVLNNLLSNAVKYSSIGGKVDVTCSVVNGKTFQVSVKDRGYGIPKGQQEKVFEKFFRADNIKSVSTEGTGLGLYIAKSIIEAHGGKIWFKSTINKGTDFIFNLPIK